jgi:hypothetical protein
MDLAYSPHGPVPGLACSYVCLHSWQTEGGGCCASLCALLASHTVLHQKFYCNEHLSQGEAISFPFFNYPKNLFKPHHPNIVVLTLPYHWIVGIPTLTLKVSSSSVNTYLMIFFCNLENSAIHGLYQLEIQSMEYKANA